MSQCDDFWVISFFFFKPFSDITSHFHQQLDGGNRTVSGVQDVPTRKTVCGEHASSSTYLDRTGHVRSGNGAVTEGLFLRPMAHRGAEKHAAHNEPAAGKAAVGSGRSRRTSY